MATKQRALNVFDVLKALDRGDMELHERISALGEAERKELDGFLSYPALRWMSAAEDQSAHGDALLLVNEFANVGYFEFGREKSLQAKLLAIAGQRRWIKHIWIAGPKNRRTSKLREALRRLWPNMNDGDCDLWYELNGIEGVGELAGLAGLQKDETKELLDECKSGS
jgi:hypothetical protein